MILELLTCRVGSSCRADCGGGVASEDNAKRDDGADDGETEISTGDEDGGEEHNDDDAEEDDDAGGYEDRPADDASSVLLRMPSSNMILRTFTHSRCFFQYALLLCVPHVLHFLLLMMMTGTVILVVTIFAALTDPRDVFLALG